MYPYHILKAKILKAIFCRIQDIRVYNSGIKDMLDQFQHYFLYVLCRSRKTIHKEKIVHIFGNRLLLRCKIDKKTNKRNVLLDGLTINYF